MTRLRLVSIDGISVPPEPIKAPDTRPCPYCGIGFGVPGMLAAHVSKCGYRRPSDPPKRPWTDHLPPPFVLGMLAGVALVLIAFAVGVAAQGGMQ